MLHFTSRHFREKYFTFHCSCFITLVTLNIQYNTFIPLLNIDFELQDFYLWQCCTDTQVEDLSTWGPHTPAGPSVCEGDKQSGVKAALCCCCCCCKRFCVMDVVAERCERLFANEQICLASRSADLWPRSVSTLKGNKVQWRLVNMDQDGKCNYLEGVLAQHKVKLLKMMHEFGGKINGWCRIWVF